MHRKRDRTFCTVRCGSCGGFSIVSTWLSDLEVVPKKIPFAGEQEEEGVVPLVWGWVLGLKWEAKSSWGPNIYFRTCAYVRLKHFVLTPSLLLLIKNFYSYVFFRTWQEGIIGAVEMDQALEPVCSGILLVNIRDRMLHTWKTAHIEQDLGAICPFK